MADTFIKSEREMGKEIFRLREVVRELDNRLNAGKHYLINTEPDKITVKGVLLAFGWIEKGVDYETQET